MGLLRNIQKYVASDKYTKEAVLAKEAIVGTYGSAAVKKNSQSELSQKDKQALKATQLGRLLADSKDFMLHKNGNDYALYNVEKNTMQIYYSDGTFKSFYNAKTGETFGFYPDGVFKTHECDGFGELFKEYYPNGQEKTTPVRQPRHMQNYEVFSADGKVIASHESSSVHRSNGLLDTTSYWVLYNGKTGNKTASYTLHEANAEGGGYLTEFSLCDSDGKEQNVSLGNKPVKIPSREDGDISPLNEKTLRGYQPRSSLKGRGTNSTSSEL